MYTVLRISLDEISAADAAGLMVDLASCGVSPEVRDKPPGTRRIVGTISESDVWTEHLSAIRHLCDSLVAKKIHIPLEIDIAVEPEDLSGKAFRSLVIDNTTLVSLSSVCAHFTITVSGS